MSQDQDPHGKAADAIDRCEIFDALDFESKDRLKAAARIRAWDPGETIIEEGTRSKDLYLIHSGKVRVHTTASGEDVQLAELGPGSLVGEVAALRGVARTSSVTALESVALVVIPGEAVEKAIEANPDLRGLLMKLIEARAMETIRKTIC